MKGLSASKYILQNDPDTEPISLKKNDKDSKNKIHDHTVRPLVITVYQEHHVIKISYITKNPVMLANSLSLMVIKWQQCVSVASRHIFGLRPLLFFFLFFFFFLRPCDTVFGMFQQIIIAVILSS